MEPTPDATWILNQRNERVILVGSWVAPCLTDLSLFEQMLQRTIISAVRADMPQLTIISRGGSLFACMSPLF